MMNTIPHAMMDREQNQLRRQEAQRDWHAHTENSTLMFSAKQLIGRIVDRLITRNSLSVSANQLRMNDAQRVELNT